MYPWYNSTKTKKYGVRVKVTSMSFIFKMLYHQVIAFVTQLKGRTADQILFPFLTILCYTIILLVILVQNLVISLYLVHMHSFLKKNWL